MCSNRLPVVQSKPDNGRLRAATFGRTFGCCRRRRAHQCCQMRRALVGARARSLARKKGARTTRARRCMQHPRRHLRAHMLRARAASRPRTALCARLGVCAFVDDRLRAGKLDRQTVQPYEVRNGCALIASHLKLSGAVRVCECERVFVLRPPQTTRD